MKTKIFLNSLLSTVLLISACLLSALPVFAGDIYESYTTGADGNHPFGQQQWAAQTFTVNTTHNCDVVSLKLARIASTDNYTATIQGRNPRNPTGELPDTTTIILFKLNNISA